MIGKKTDKRLVLNAFVQGLLDEMHPQQKRTVRVLLCKTDMVT